MLNGLKQATPEPKQLNEWHTENGNDVYKNLSGVLNQLRRNRWGYIPILCRGKV